MTVEPGKAGARATAAGRRGVRAVRAATARRRAHRAAGQGRAVPASGDKPPERASGVGQRPQRRAQFAAPPRIARKPVDKVEPVEIASLSVSGLAADHRQAAAPLKAVTVRSMVPSRLPSRAPAMVRTSSRLSRVAASIAMRPEARWRTGDWRKVGPPTWSR